MRALLSGFAALPIPVAVAAQSFNHAELALFRALKRQPNALARYTYLSDVMPSLSPVEQRLALQLFASAESELGLYDQAILAFPLKSRIPPDVALPTAAGWRARDAVQVITRLAADRRIVMINEAHHNAHTRVLTLALLPRLRALGFNYFAAEALTDDPNLMHRGYPVNASGTEYLHEPLYGDIVRAAIQLGFTVVSYDAGGGSTQARETAQAENLYRKVVASDPGARLFVHAGYAHIDKARGRLGPVAPMAMQLQKLTGHDPLSIDQTEFLQDTPSPSGPYGQLVDRFHPESPVVLLHRGDGKPWSDQPALYDLNVILPPSVSLDSFGDESLYGTRLDSKTLLLRDTTRFSFITPNLNFLRRPAWLALDRQRSPYPISTSLCRTTVPCVVEAQYLDEATDAVAADRYAFLKPNGASKLYLRPGGYRLRARGVDSKTLSRKIIRIAETRPSAEP
ncbi:MAG: hypothetical protein EPN74_11895 [Rhodanobacter sp.]|nr:MAG: hypothetical protein EPN74_11895 [Rhodanobacter sp.]